MWQSCSTTSRRWRLRIPPSARWPTSWDAPARSALFQDGNKFLASLAGDMNRTLGGVGTDLIKFANDEGVKKVTGLLQDAYNIGKMASETGFSPALLKYALGKGEALLSDPAVAKALEFSRGASNLMKDLAQGKLTQGLNEIGAAANTFLGSDAWKDASSLFRSGENLMQSVFDGSLEKALSRAGLDPGIRGAVNTVLGFAGAGRDFLSTMENELVAPQLAAFLKGAQQTLPEFTEALRGVAEGASTFGELAGGSFGQVLKGFETEMQNLSQLAGGSPMMELEKEAQDWVQQGNMEFEFVRNLTATLRQQTAATKEVAVLSRISVRL